MGMINLVGWDDRDENVNEIDSKVTRTERPHHGSFIHFFATPTRSPGFGNASGFDTADAGQNSGDWGIYRTDCGDFFCSHSGKGLNIQEAFTNY